MSWFSCLSTINTIIESKHCQGTWHSVNTRYLLDSQGQDTEFQYFDISFLYICQLWPSHRLSWYITPALSQDQDLKNALLIPLIIFWPNCHTDTGNGCKNLQTWEKKCFMALFWLKKAVFSNFEHQVWFGLVRKHQGCVSVEILNCFDP